MNTARTSDSFGPARSQGESETPQERKRRLGREANRRWRERNLEKAREASRRSIRKWRAKNLEQSRALCREHHAKNAEAIREQKREYYQRVRKQADKTDAGLLADRNRKARRRSLTKQGNVTKEEWDAPSVAVTDGSRKTRSGNRSDELLLTGQAEQVSRWMSPKASDPEKAGPNMRGSKGDVPLPAQAVQWMTPMTPMTADDGRKVTHATKQYSLIQQAERDFHLPSSPAHPTVVAGALCSTDTPNTNQPSVKRKLNPIFVEALMRWPTGLSGFERPEMALTLWQQRMGSFLSALYSQPEAAQQELF